MKLQKTGAGMLIAALVLTWLRLDWFAVFALAAVGVLDLYLLKMRKATISEWVRGRFPRSMDIGLTIALLATTWWMGPPTFLPVMLGAIIGHLLWSGE
jgi:hypothetical protein